MGDNTLNNRHRNGVKAELSAALTFIEKGYDIFWPHMGQSSCDFIAIKGSETVRVQVKAAYWMERPSGARYLQATTRKGCGSPGYKTYTKEDCDVLAIHHETSSWIIPVEELDGAQTVTLAKDQDKRCSRKGRKDWSKFKS